MKEEASSAQVAINTENRNKRTALKSNDVENMKQKNIFSFAAKKRQAERMVAKVKPNREKNVLIPLKEFPNIIRFFFSFSLTGEKLLLMFVFKCVFDVLLYRGQLNPPHYIAGCAE